MQNESKYTEMTYTLAKPSLKVVNKMEMYFNIYIFLNYVTPVYLEDHVTHGRKDLGLF